MGDSADPKPEPAKAEPAKEPKPPLEEYASFLKKCRTAQVLGFDVMLDAKGGMHLLEVNNSPSLSLEEIAQVAAGASEEDLAKCCAVDGIVGGYVCTEVGCEYSDGERCGPPRVACRRTLLVLAGLWHRKPHIHREGRVDVAIKTPAVTALLRLLSEPEALAGSSETQKAFLDGLGAREVPLPSTYQILSTRSRWGLIYACCCTCC